MPRLPLPASRLLLALALVITGLGATSSSLAQSDVQADTQTADTSPKEDQRWYRVEIILFENNNTDAALEEVWPTQLTLPNTDGLGTLYDPPPGFSFTDNSQLTLGKIKGHLAYSKHYKPIMHFGWTQRGLPKNRAVPLRVQGGLKFVAPVPRNPVPEPVISQAASNSEVTADGGVSTYGIAEETPVVAAEVSQIDGTLTLSLGRYLHIETDLIYRRLVQSNTLRTRGNPMASGADFGNGTQVMGFRMKQYRKMRSRELHYLDHPMFGMLIEVTPVETDA